jgi:hypothetical protein
MGEAPPLKKPLDWDELYPGRFLKAGQLGERKPTLTIKAVEVDRLLDDKGQEKVKGVITFNEIAYQLALNKTNGLCLREMFGRELEKWVGHKVTLYRSAVESGSRKGEPAVRVWGSPELEADRTVEVKLPRKRPMQMVMHAVKGREATQREVDKHPTEGKAPGNTSGGEPPPFG